jgi:hypothetical protein
MVILYIYSTCWYMKSMFYERQQGAKKSLAHWVGKTSWPSRLWDTETGRPPVAGEKNWTDQKSIEETVRPWCGKQEPVTWTPSLSVGSRDRTTPARHFSSRMSTPRSSGNRRGKMKTTQLICKNQFFRWNQTRLQLWNRKVSALPPSFDYWYKNLVLGSLSLI